MTDPIDHLTRCRTHLSAATHTSGAISAHHLAAARSAHAAAMQELEELDHVLAARESAMVDGRQLTIGGTDGVR